MSAIIYSKHYLEHETELSHPESPNRLRAIMSGIERFRLLDTKKCQLIEPKKASLKEIERVHDPSYVKMIREICEQGGGWIDEDTVLSEKSYEIALLATGGTLKACELVLSGKFNNAFALVRPPGHHVGFYGRALSASSQGFCVFNNVAIAATNLIENYGLKRVLILDIDVHHGNGTQEIFDERSDVLYISLHQYGIYPHTGFADEIGKGEGRGFSVNIPLPPASCDDIYSEAFEQVVSPIAIEYKPEFVLISAGFDAQKEDPLSRMGLSNMGYLKQFETILSITEKTCFGRVVAVLEGGYNATVLSELAPAVIAKMARIPFPVKGEETISSPSVRKQAEAFIRQVKENLAPYWRL